MANGRFVNDYSFLNLPELGSAVRSPIEIAQESLPPSVLQQIDFSAPQELPEADLLTRGGTPNIIPTRPQGILGTPNFRNILQTAVTNAEAEIQMLREAKIDLTNQYEQAVAQQDVITAQAAEDQLAAVNAKEQELLTERANIIAELEDKFGVEREELQTNIATLEGTITDLQGSIDALTLERDDAIAEQDVIRATAADEQAKALEAQKTSLEADYADQIATLQTEIDKLSASDVVAETAPVVAEDLPVITDVVAEDLPAITDVTGSVVTAPTAEEYMNQLPADIAEKESAADLGFDPYNPSYMGFEDERAIGRQNEADALANLQAASAAGTASLSDVQAAKDASANLIAQQAFVESGGKTLQQELADLEREKEIQRALENRTQVTSAAPPVVTPLLVKDFVVPKREAYKDSFVPITGVDLGISKPAITSLTPVAPSAPVALRKSAPINMSRVNLPINYLAKLQNIQAPAIPSLPSLQTPRNLNLGSLRAKMASGGDINKIDILLKKIG